MARFGLTLLALLLLSACQAGQGSQPVSGVYVGGAAGVGQSSERVKSSP